MWMCFQQHTFSCEFPRDYGWCTYRLWLKIGEKSLKWKRNKTRKHRKQTNWWTQPCLLFFFPDKSPLNFLFTAKKKLCTFSPCHQKTTHQNGLSPAALPPAIQWHFESKLVSIRGLMWCQQVRCSPQGTKIIVNELAERSPKHKTHRL